MPSPLSAPPPPASSACSRRRAPGSWPATWTATAMPTSSSASTSPPAAAASSRQTSSSEAGAGVHLPFTRIAYDCARPRKSYLGGNDSQAVPPGRPVPFSPGPPSKYHFDGKAYVRQSEPQPPRSRQSVDEVAVHLGGDPARAHPLRSDRRRRGARGGAGGDRLFRFPVE